MFKNYVKTALRNLKKNKSYSLINIAGLAIGMAVSFLILLFVVNELTYDRFHEKSQNIYRLAGRLETEGRILDIPSMPGPLGPALVNQFPEVIHAVRLQGCGNRIVAYEDKLFEESEIYCVDVGLFDIFSIDVIKGNPESFLQAPFNLIMTEEIADKYFGEEDPIGKMVRFDSKDVYTVTGVVKKMPENSHFKFDMLISFSTLEKIGRNPNQWMNFNYYTYIELQEHFPVIGLSKKYYEFLWANIPDQIKQLGIKLDLILQPLASIHLHSHLMEELQPPGNLAYIRIFTTIALFILLIACINFMNLATAQSAHRAKEVGMRKVLGAHRRKLISQFLGESLLLSMISLIFAVFLIILLLPLFNQLINKELVYHPLQNWQLSIGLVGITSLVGMISGAYPAFFLSSFVPLEVLKARFKAGKSHRFFRNGLVSLQYTISIVLICSTIVIFFQLNFIKHRSLGFNQEQVAVLPLGGQAAQKYGVFKTEILGLPGVKNAACSSLVPASGSDETYFTFEGFSEENRQVLPFMEIDEDYLETMGMTLSLGRNFSKNFPSDNRALILNETLAQQLGWENPIGKTVKMTDVVDRKFVEIPYTVIGVVKDFHFESLHQKIRGHIMKMLGKPNKISVKLNPENLPEILSRMQAIWQEIEPGRPFQYTFMDDTFDRLYRTEERLGQIFIAFTLIAIFVACLGLFGLASFATEQRTKEIGIRKVLGASVSHVVTLLSRDFTKWVVLANIAAWPIAYFAMSKWLQGFAYRIQLDFWIFLLSGFIALVIALLTVSSRTVKVAVSNPVDSLRYE